MFQDGHGHEIRVVTDLRTISAEQVAEIYKKRCRSSFSFDGLSSISMCPLYLVQRKMQYMDSFMQP